MKFDDIKDSTDLAEVLGLLASLVAAILALREAKKDSEDSRDDPAAKEGPAADVKIDYVLIKDDVPRSKLSNFLKKNSTSILFGVVSFQFIFILFIAWRLM